MRDGTRRDGNWDGIWAARDLKHWTRDLGLDLGPTTGIPALISENVFKKQESDGLAEINGLKFSDNAIPITQYSHIL